MAAEDVAKPSAEQANMVTRSAMARTLMGGTPAMRAAGKTYLPKESAEDESDWQNRRDRTFLFNAFGKTVEDMTGKVFTKPIVLKDNVPAQIKTFAENIDLTGRHINVFAESVFKDGLQTGIGFILTDVPAAPTGVTPVTQADDAVAGLRPYLVFIPLERLIGWKSETVGGVERLTQIRIKECVKQPDGEFGETEIEQIRVIDAPAVGIPATWRTFRKQRGQNGEDVWISVANGSYKLDKITLSVFYANRTDFMQAEPPLAKLAELNVEHWQSKSDQKNILHVARVPILFGAGFTDDTKMAVGANSMVRASDPNAKLTFVEHSGKAIEAGDKDLDNIEDQMEVMGLQLLTNKPSARPTTATGAVIDTSKENSSLARMATALEDAIEVSFGFMAEYIGLGTDAGGEVELNKDYGLSSLDVPQIVAAFAAGMLDAQTAVDELKRRGFLNDSVDPEVVMQRLQNAASLDAKRAMDLSGANDGPASGQTQ